MIEKQLAEMIMVGKVEEVDYTRARVRVSFGETRTYWVPWMQRAGQIKEWNPPSEGEQVVVACPNGNRALAICLGGINYDGNPAPFDSGSLGGHKYDDGACITYDQRTGTLEAKLTEGGTATVTIGEITAIATQTEIKAMVSGASLSIKAEEIKASLGSATMSATQSGITLSFGSAKIEITGAGVKITGQTDFVP